MWIVQQIVQKFNNKLNQSTLSTGYCICSCDALNILSTWERFLHDEVDVVALFAEDRQILWEGIRPYRTPINHVFVDESHPNGDFRSTDSDEPSSRQNLDSFPHSAPLRGFFAILHCLQCPKLCAFLGYFQGLSCWRLGSSTPPSYRDPQFFGNAP